MLVYLFYDGVQKISQRTAIDHWFQNSEYLLEYFRNIRKPKQGKIENDTGGDYQKKSHAAAKLLAEF